MGKRELLIAVAFVLVGIVAYQLAAPPPKDGERGFSLSRLFSNMRREIRGNPSRATAKHQGTLPVTAAVTEVRLTPGRSFTIAVTGEAREDVGYEWQINSNGPDEPTAKAWAEKARLITDDLGSAIALRFFLPEEGQQSGTLTLRVPARLTVRVDGGVRGRISGVRAAHLGNAVGELTLEAITAAVSGSHRAGELELNNVGSANLMLQSSRAKLRGLKDGATLNLRGGECEISSSAGPIDLTAMNAETTITAHDGPVQVGGEGGNVRIRAPGRDVKVDMRRTEVDIQLDGAAAVTALTTDEPLRVQLNADAPIEIDASASDGGQVQAGDFNLQAEKADRTSRLTHAFGDKKSARVILRNVRGDIVIGKRK
jgi:hypothetical protein